eukprot:353615-Chlamydomonas_euryale.AAC.6
MNRCSVCSCCCAAWMRAVHLASGDTSWMASRERECRYDQRTFRRCQHLLFDMCFGGVLRISLMPPLQAQKLLSEQPIQVAFNLGLREEVLVEKCLGESESTVTQYEHAIDANPLGRRLCRHCGKNYNLANIRLPAGDGKPEIIMPPLNPPPGCAPHLSKRDDDTEEVILRRLQVSCSARCVWCHSTLQKCHSHQPLLQHHLTLAPCKLYKCLISENVLGCATPVHLCCTPESQCTGYVYQLTPKCQWIIVSTKAQMPVYRNCELTGAQTPLSLHQPNGLDGVSPYPTARSTAVETGRAMKKDGKGRGQDNEGERQ